jgi:hypothetical protein
MSISGNAGYQFDFHTKESLASAFSTNDSCNTHKKLGVPG